LKTLVVICPANISSIWFRSKQKKHAQNWLRDLSLFDIFSFPFIYGAKKSRRPQPNNSNPKVHNNNWFGDTNPIGKMVRFNNTTSFAVTGVIKDIPQTHFSASMPLLPVQNLKNLWGRDNVMETGTIMPLQLWVAKIADGFSKKWQQTLPIVFKRAARINQLSQGLQV
jgi:hypothetical protein